MTKFQVLEYNQAMMAYFRSHSNGFARSSVEFFKSFGTCYVLFYVVGFVIISSVVFVFKHWPQVELLLGPCFIIIAGLQGTGMLVYFGLEMPTINAVNQKLQRIVDKGDFLFIELLQLLMMAHLQIIFFI